MNTWKHPLLRATRDLCIKLSNSYTLQLLTGYIYLSPSERLASWKGPILNWNCVSLFIEEDWKILTTIYYNFYLILGDTSVIYKRVVVRKKDWQEDLVYFVYWINKINKRMKYLASWQAFIWSAASGCFDLVWRCCRVKALSHGWRFNCPCDLPLPYLCVSDFKHWLQKILFVEKIWLIEK